MNITAKSNRKKPEIDNNLNDSKLDRSTSKNPLDKSELEEAPSIDESLHKHVKNRKESTVSNMSVDRGKFKKAVSQKCNNFKLCCKKVCAKKKRKGDDEEEDGKESNEESEKKVPENPYEIKYSICCKIRKNDAIKVLKQLVTMDILTLLLQLFLDTLIIFSDSLGAFFIKSWLSLIFLIICTIMYCFIDKWDDEKIAVNFSVWKYFRIIMIVACLIKKLVDFGYSCYDLGTSIAKSELEIEIDNIITTAVDLFFIIWWIYLLTLQRVFNKVVKFYQIRVFMLELTLLGLVKLLWAILKAKSDKKFIHTVLDENQEAEDNNEEPSPCNRKTEFNFEQYNAQMIVQAEVMKQHKAFDLKLASSLISEIPDEVNKNSARLESVMDKNGLSFARSKTDIDIKDNGSIGKIPEERRNCGSMEMNEKKNSSREMGDEKNRDEDFDAHSSGGEDKIGGFDFGQDEDNGESFCDFKMNSKVNPMMVSRDLKCGDENRIGNPNNFVFTNEVIIVKKRRKP